MPKAKPPPVGVPATLAKEARFLDADRSTPPLPEDGFSAVLLPKMELPGGVLEEEPPKMEEVFEGVAEPKIVGFDAAVSGAPLLLSDCFSCEIEV